MADNQTPQVQALRSLQQHFKTEQLQQIANACDELKAKGGWGEIDIHFDHGDPVRIGITVTRKLIRNEYN